jgi:hypothetical protein
MDTFSCSGHCIVGVWLHGSVLRPSDCPLCRRPITLLVPSEVASLMRDEPEITPVVERIEQYNGRFAGAPHSVIQVILPYLLRATAIWVTHFRKLKCSWLHQYRILFLASFVM